MGGASSSVLRGDRTKTFLFIFRNIKALTFVTVFFITTRIVNQNDISFILFVYYFKQFFFQGGYKKSEKCGVCIENFPSPPPPTKEKIYLKFQSKKRAFPKKKTKNSLFVGGLGRPAIGKT